MSGKQVLCFALKPFSVTKLSMVHGAPTWDQRETWARPSFLSKRGHWCSKVQTAVEWVTSSLYGWVVESLEKKNVQVALCLAVTHQRLFIRVSAKGNLPPLAQLLTNLLETSSRSGWDHGAGAQQVGLTASNRIPSGSLFGFLVTWELLKSDPCTRVLTLPEVIL